MDIQETAMSSTNDGGYGEYIIEVKGYGLAHNADPQTISFTYVPVTTEIIENDDGTFVAELTYDASIVCGVDVEVLNSTPASVWNGQITSAQASATSVVTKTIELPFATTEDVSKTDTYTVRTTAYSCADNTLLYKPMDQTVDYENIVVPDTGALFKNLNISRTDYLITGILIFSIFAICAFVFTAKRQKNYRKAYAKRGGSLKSANYKKVTPAKAKAKTAKVTTRNIKAPKAKAKTAQKRH